MNGKGRRQGRIAVSSLGLRQWLALAIPAALLGVIVMLTPSVSVKAATAYDPTVYAEDHLTGYLWSDSTGGDKSTWSSHNGDAAVRDRFYNVAVALKKAKFPNATVTKTSTSVSITNMPLSIPLDRLPTITQTALNNHNKNALIAFSTSVIEGEGTQSGEIIDDPLAAHRNAFISVMTELGVRTDIFPPKPNQGIMAVQADWPIIQCWPFASFNRVPGGPPSAGMCDSTSTDQPPTVTLSSPAATSTVSPSATVTIAGSATDDKGVSKVDVKVDGTLLKSFTTSSFTTTWTAPSTAGNHTITATATDTAGQTKTDTATVTVSSPGGQPCTPPATDYGTVSLSTSVSTAGTYRVWSRLAAADTTNNTYLLEIDGSSCYKVGGSSVPVYTSGSTTHFTSGSANWLNKTSAGTVIDVSLTAGSHTLKLIGNGDGLNLDRLILTQDTACVPSGTGDNCTSSTDTTDPVVAITAPPAGTNVTTTTNIRVQATDDTAVTKVEFYIDGLLKGTDTVTNAGGYYTYSLDPTTLADGNHNLTAKAYDGAGNNSTSAAVQISTGTTPPPPTTPGDINGDNKVDFLDFSILASKYGQTGTNLGGADLNNDSKVDFLDVSILAAHYGG